MINGLYIMDKNISNDVYPKSIRDEIEKFVNIYQKPLETEEVLTDMSVLKNAEVLFLSWGAPVLNKEFLEASPSLKAVFYGGGSVRNIVTPDFWRSGIKLTSAYAANAKPVAEFTLAQILFSLKSGWYYMDRIRLSKMHKSDIFVHGAYNSTVGLVSLGQVGRRVAELLKFFDLEIIAYDPFISKEEASALNVTMVSIEELFERSHVVSLHTPWLSETEGMINGRLFSLMKKGATFINTARGAVVNEKEMIQVLRKRRDITALLDVTYPEPPVKGSPLYSMDNIFLTPHIAGSLNREYARIGFYMVEELKRYVSNEDFKWKITEENAKILA